jgi:hypothetical protein
MKPIKPGESITIDFGSVIEKMRKGIKPDHTFEFTLPGADGQPKTHTILLYDVDGDQDDQ